MPDPGASHAYIRLGRFALIVTTLLWGSSFTIMKDALATVPTLWLLATRFSGAAMLMALIGIRSLRRLDHGYLTGGACMGVCLYLAYSIQTYGLVHTTPGKNAFLAATYCVFVPFFWWLIHKRRPDRYNLAAALLCLCGMGVVSLQSDLRIGRGEGLTMCRRAAEAKASIPVCPFWQRREQEKGDEDGKPQEGICAAVL